jgi:hypothetical protein
MPNIAWERATPQGTFRDSIFLVKIMFEVPVAMI